MIGIKDGNYVVYLFPSETREDQQEMIRVVSKFQKRLGEAMRVNHAYRFHVQMEEEDYHGSRIGYQNMFFFDQEIDAREFESSMTGWSAPLKSIPATYHPETVLDSRKDLR